MTWKQVVYAEKVGRWWVAIFIDTAGNQYHSRDGRGGHHFGKLNRAGYAEVRDRAGREGQRYKTLRDLKADFDEQYYNVIRFTDPPA